MAKNYYSIDILLWATQLDNVYKGAFDDSYLLKGHLKC